MQAAQGSLTLLNAHTREPHVFWNGIRVEGIVRLHVHNDEDESRVKLFVLGGDDAVIASMLAAGVNVRRVTP